MLFSCGKSSSLNNDFHCKTDTYGNLETRRDFNKNFRIKLPKTWKTNYYYDNTVSSIFSADTTLNLTKTTLIDASFVTSGNEFDQEFINKIKSDNEQMGLTEILSKSGKFDGKPMYYNLSKGKRTKFDYQILNVFIKANLGFLHVKTEVYGDLLVDERFCKAVDLINKIEILDD